MIRAADLCAYARDAVGLGYCYGSQGEICSEKNRQEWARANPSQRQNLLGVCAKWDGRRVWDCSGLFRGAYRALMAYKSGGATTIFGTWLKESGVIGTMPDAPGIAVFRGNGRTMEHVGLYVGDGQVVDARGSQKGVVIGPVTSYAWTHWGRLADVLYTGGEAPVEEPLYTAVVSGVKVGLNLRTSPTNGMNTVLLIPPGAAVDVLREECGEGFALVRYFGTRGYCTKGYLRAVEGDG